MDSVHFFVHDRPLCGSQNPLWCTLLRESVTCPECLARLADADQAREAPALVRRRDTPRWLRRPRG